MEAMRSLFGGSSKTLSLPEASETYWLPFVENHLPHTFRLIKDSNKSRFYRMIENTFALLHDLQFHCLTFKYRALGVSKFIASKKEEKMSEMKERFDQLIERENRYLAEEGYEFSTLSPEQTSIAQTTRLVIFRLIHEEQQALKEQDAFLPFLSIWNAQGEKNSQYKAQMLANQMKKFREIKKETMGKTNEFIDRVESLFKEHLAEKKWSYQDLKKPEQLLADAAKESAFQALLKALYTEPNALFEDHSHLYSTTISYEKGSNIQYWEQLEELKQKTIASNLTREKWQKYSYRENELFEELYGYKRQNLSPEMQELALTVRTITFKIIYEEQEEIGDPFPSLPFASIYDKDGGMNSDYWIDLLDAKTKRMGEKPPGEKIYLKECCDYDIMRILHAPPEEEGTISTTGLRKNGALTPLFCDEVLQNLLKLSDHVKSKLDLNSNATDSEHLQAIFQSNKLSREEQILCFQNEFCDVLSTMYYLQGDSASLFKLMKIHFKKISPRLLFLAEDPTNKEGTKHDLFSEISSMEEECETIQKWMEESIRLPKIQTSPTKRKQGKDEMNLLIDLVTSKMLGYTGVLKMMAEQIGRLGNILNYFSMSLIDSSILVENPTPRTRKRNVSLDFAVISPRRRFHSLESLPELPPEIATIEKESKAVNKSSQKGSSTMPKLLIKSHHRASSSTTQSNSPKKTTGIHSPRITDSPRIGEMSPKKFAISSALCLRIQKFFENVAFVIDTEVQNLAKK